MQKKGFTLVELIIVISIIALLSVVGMSTYVSVQVDARNSKRKSDLKDIQAALAVYRSENGVYPSTCHNGSTTCSTDFPYHAICTTGWSNIVCGPDYIPGLAPDYMSRLPTDPRQNMVNPSSATNRCQTNTNMNTYLYRSNGTDYKLLALCTPEGELDPDDPFSDPARPTEAWQISSSENTRNW